MHRVQQANAEIRAPPGTHFDLAEEVNDHRKLQRILSIQDRFPILERLKSVFNETGLTMCLFKDVRDRVKMVAALKPGGADECSLMWLRQMELAFLELREGTSRRATTKYVGRVPNYEDAFLWIDDALGPLGCETWNDWKPVKWLELEAIMYERTGLTGYIAAIDIKTIKGNGTMLIEKKSYNRALHLLTVITGNGQVIHAETMWATETVEDAFRHSQIFQWLQTANFPMISRVIDEIKVSVQGFMSTDHQANFSRQTARNVLSGCAENAAGLSAAENFVNLAINKGQRKCEHFFAAMQSAYTCVAALPSIAGDFAHNHDMYLAILPVKLRQLMLHKEHLQKLETALLAEGCSSADPNLDPYSKVVAAHKGVAAQLALLRYPGQLWEPRQPMAMITGHQVPPLDVDTTFLNYIGAEMALLSATAKDKYKVEALKLLMDIKKNSV